jgi:hypothetical protein
MARNMIIGCMMLGLLLCAQSAVGAQYDYELAYGYSSRDSGSREAVAMDDWLERGRAAVTESPVFPDGVRLTAWGGENAYEPGLASAIYYFKVPRWAQYLKITVQYRDEARDDTIAGRLWIKSADRDQYETVGAGEEAPLYGDTFVLRSERTSETIIVPRSRHVEDDKVEMHIVAEGQDCLDVRDVRLVYLETRPGNITVVHRTYNDYWDRWPSYRYAYHYYYWGPLFWPKTLVVYECWDIPSPFYWITWRPWFFVNIIRVHHHHPWWGPRRYTVIYHVDVKQPPIKRKPLIHKQLKERQVYITKTISPKPLTRNIVPPSVPANQPRQQEVRLQKESAPARAVEATISRDPTPRNLKKQPLRAGAEHAKQQSQLRPVNREKTVQAPVQKQLTQTESVAPKATKSVQSTPLRRPNTRQENQKLKEATNTPLTAQAKTVKKEQTMNKSAVSSRRPSPAVTQRIQPKETPQPQTAKQQPRPRSVTQETVQKTTTPQTPRNHRIQQEGAVQKHAKIGQGNSPQSQREDRQPPSYAAQRRLK